MSQSDLIFLRGQERIIFYHYSLRFKYVFLINLTNYYFVASVIEIEYISLKTIPREKALLRIKWLNFKIMKSVTPPLF